MVLVILPITNPMIRKTSLPYRRTCLQPKRESSLDELHGALQRDFRRRGQQSMDMIGHDDEFVEKEFVFVSIMHERFHQEIGCCVPSEDGLTVSGDGGDEEDTVGIHPAMFVGWVSLVCERCHNSRESIPKRYTGPKGRLEVVTATRPSKGRSSTVLSGTCRGRAPLQRRVRG